MSYSMHTLDYRILSSVRVVFDLNFMFQKAIILVYMRKWEKKNNCKIQTRARRKRDKPSGARASVLPLLQLLSSLSDCPLDVVEAFSGSPPSSMLSSCFLFNMVAGAACFRCCVLSAWLLWFLCEDPLYLMCWVSGQEISSLLPELSQLHRNMVVVLCLFTCGLPWRIKKKISESELNTNWADLFAIIFIRILY